MSPNPPNPWYRRSWSYANRPYSGCGCIWFGLSFLVLSLLASAVLSLIFPDTRICLLPFFF